MDSDTRPTVEIQTKVGETMINMTSTLVETVSINYEDFNESFLTCGTCLCMYDGSEHTPKLLACSHTVCLHCLTRIAASSARDDGTFRCPICRELITIPRGGVSALPPSFLVNQLLDLMARQRRHVIPKCSTHVNQELLFCETCDAVFCSVCVGGSHTGSSLSPSPSPSHSSGSSSLPLAPSEHTIIPFSIAIKRMSEILLYKANECITKLNEASTTVEAELSHLESSVESTLDQINRCFQDSVCKLERRRQQLMTEVKSIAEEKQKVLGEQLTLIAAEKSRVEKECDGLQWQVEVRHISRRIVDLSTKLDSVGALAEPRQNAYLTFQSDHNDSLHWFETAVSGLGKLHTSCTLPSLCSLSLDFSADEPLTCGLQSSAALATVDWRGEDRQNGGDPIEAFLDETDNDKEKKEAKPVIVRDMEDGTYQLFFRPTTAGNYALHVNLFGRPVRGSPLSFSVWERNSPVACYGTRGSGKSELLQPVAVVYNTNQGEMCPRVYVLDTGNARIKVLTPDLSLVQHLENDVLTGRSSTGLAIDSDGKLLVVNWRNCQVVLIDPGSGETITTFTHCDFQEPVAVASTPQGQVVVGDNGASALFIFDKKGQFLFRINGRNGKSSGINNKQNFSVSAIASAPTGELVVADSRILVFSAKGSFLREIYGEGKGKGRYGGITVDEEGRVIATRAEKHRTVIQVFQLNNGNLITTIDSYGTRLKRPSGVACIDNEHILVADLGNDSILKYRYC